MSIYRDRTLSFTSTLTSTLCNILATRAASPFFTAARRHDSEDYKAAITHEYSLNFRQ